MARWVEHKECSHKQKDASIPTNLVLFPSRLVACACSISSSLCMLGSCAMNSKKKADDDDDDDDDDKT